MSTLAVSLAAGFSGSVAAAASHCFDTAKSRSQCTVLPKVFYVLQKDCYIIAESYFRNHGFFPFLYLYAPTVAIASIQHNDHIFIKFIILTISNADP